MVEERSDETTLYSGAISKLVTFEVQGVKMSEIMRKGKIQSTRDKNERNYLSMCKGKIQSTWGKNERNYAQR